MRKLLILLLFVPVMSFGQIWKYSDPLDPTDKLFAGDKIDHITYSCYGVMLTSAIFQELKIKDPEVKGVFVMLSVGFAKEFLYDKRPSSGDLMANFTGVVTGYYIARWCNKRYAQEKIRKPTVTNAVN